MKVVYVAGPYRDKRGSWYVQQNIARAAIVARELWMMGLAVICPHANTAMMDGEGTDDMFLKGDLEILSRCDGVVVLPGWVKSVGASAEAAEARRRGMPVFQWDPNGTMGELRKWAASNR